MPRRPRPAARAATSKLKSKLSPPILEEHDDQESDDEAGTSGSEGSASALLDEDQEVEEDQDDDVDAPRISQWEGDDDIVCRSDADEELDNAAGPSQLKSLEQDLSSLPLGALRRAQRALTQTSAIESGSENSSEDEDGSETPEPVSSRSKEKEKEKPEWSIEPRRDIAKRANKHAPVEVTSKRPVTRKRTVVEVKTPQARDPRFLPLAGEFLPHKFQEQYGFLVDAHKRELQTLRENLKTARKRLLASPRDLRAEREAEVGRLEVAVKRAESSVNSDRRAKVDQEALTRLNEAESAKRKEGKGSWYMKNAAKKEFLVRARYDALAKEGGKRAVKKAIEKKQKKIGQKEKRSRPFAKGSGLKRSPEEGDSGRPKKRPRSTQ